MANAYRSTLEGSCHCRTITYTILSHTPVPYQLCTCSICRKLGGSFGAINIGGLTSTLKVLTGISSLKKYNAIKDHSTGEKWDTERAFCAECGTMLWYWCESYGELLTPFASSIDTELQRPQEIVCMYAADCPSWGVWPEGKKVMFEGKEKESLEEWHKRMGCYVE